jgi:hypothetical protein
MSSNPYAGSWRLISMQTKPANGNPNDNETYDTYGPNAAGSLMYGELTAGFGTMAVQIVSANRPNFVSGDIDGGTVEERLMAYDTCLAYHGQYSFDAEKVLHHIEICLYPNWGGQTVIRYARFEGNRLFLVSPPFLVKGILRTSNLIWERV